METQYKTTITVQCNVMAPIDKVWEYWTTPEHIKQWNTASPDWHTTHSENDLRAGGKFSSRMEAKDGSFGFDFWGFHETVITHELINSKLGDERKLKVEFKANGEETEIIESFEAESTNPIEMQQFGWQSILNNFKKYTESH